MLYAIVSKIITVKGATFMQSLLTIKNSSSLIQTFLSGRTPTTLRAYSNDLQHFASFLSKPAEEALYSLLNCTQGEANALVLSYRHHLVNLELSSATINRRLAAIRSIVQLARMLGLTVIQLEISNLKVESYRDTRGPGSEKVSAMLYKLNSQKGLPNLRNYAIARLLFDLGLRRGEVASLDIEHFNLNESTLQVAGKGRSNRLTLTLPKVTCDAINAWLEASGRSTGPLFIALNNAAFGHRLTGEAIYQIVNQCGKLVGVAMRPHGLRHSAITRLLELTNDVTKVQRFSRHADLRTLTIYDDRRQDIAGEMANLLANAA